MKRLVLLVLAALPWLAAWAQDVLPVPELTARVIDQTGTLQPAQRESLEDKLAAFEKDTGTQIAILMVPTTQPEDIFGYANRVANAWKIGRRDVGDGVLVVVAKDDRRVRIEVAKTLEGAIPDLAARQIIERAITPAFRQGDFAGGLHAAVDQLMARIRGEALPAPAQRPVRDDTGFDWFDLAIFLFFAVPIAGGILRGLLGGKLGSLVTGGGAGVLALLVTSSIVIAVLAGLVALVVSLFSGGIGGVPRRRTHGHWGGGPWIGPGWGGGGWSGGGWGGGFGSGGGGDFGGGGASGDW